MLEDNLLLAVQIASSPAVITPYFDNNSPVYNYYSPFLDIVSANLKVDETSANLQTAVGEADVSDELDPTFITVDPAVTNITQTDPQGGFRTDPANLALLPYIRY
jgi:hypothetical protein